MPFLIFYHPSSFSSLSHTYHTYFFSASVSLSAMWSVSTRVCRLNGGPSVMQPELIGDFTLTLTNLHTFLGLAAVGGNEQTNCHYYFVFHCNTYRENFTHGHWAPSADREGEVNHFIHLSGIYNIERDKNSHEQ